MSKNPKPNQRSIRYSDEIAEIIDSQIGENFSDKFEKLIYNSYIQVEKQKEEAERYKKMANTERQRYFKLMNINIELRKAKEAVDKSIEKYEQLVQRGLEALE